MNEWMNWVEVAAVDEIPEMGSRMVEVDELNIALFHLRGGQVRAVDNHCPHKGGPLAEGIVAEEFVYSLGGEFAGRALSRSRRQAVSERIRST